MEQNTKKTVWISLLVIIALAVVAYLWTRDRSGEKQIQNPSSESVDAQDDQIESETGQSEASSSNNQAVTSSADEIYPEDKRSTEKADEAFRQQVIAYVNQNLAKLVPPPTNDEWDLPTLYFVGNSNVYLELYPLETDLSGIRILYKAEKDKNTIKITEVARYSEGETDWVLNQGKDDYADYVREEYDINEDNNKWEKTDEFSESEYSEEIEPSEEEYVEFLP